MHERGNRREGAVGSQIPGGGLRHTFNLLPKGKRKGKGPAAALGDK